MTIFFYEVDKPYGCFSNFSPHGIELEGHLTRNAQEEKTVILHEYHTDYPHIFLALPFIMGEWTAILTE